MSERALRTRLGEREGSRRRRGLVILPSERFGGGAVGGHARRETEARSCAGLQSDPLSKADDRIEHDPDGAGEGPAIEGLRIVRSAAAAKESRAIGFELQRSLGPAFETHGVKRPGTRVLRIAAPAMTD